MMDQTAQNNQGMYLVEEGNHAFRTERFREAIALHLKALTFLTPQSLEMAECLDHLGQEYWRVGDVSAALQFSKRALEIKERQIPESSSLAKTLSNIGCIFHERGEYEKAYYLIHRALSIRQKLDPPASSLEVAVTYTNLGLVLMHLGRAHEAVHMHQQAQQIKEQVAPNSTTLARTYINLANVRAALRDTPAALAWLRKARQIGNRLEPRSASLVAMIDMNMGNLMFGEGRVDKAVRCYQRAMEREETVAPDSLILAEMCTALGRACDALGRTEEAQAAHARALRIRSRKAPAFLEEQSEICK